MSFRKAIQSVTVFIIIPLMLAVHSGKIPLQAALDLIVWYIAVAFFIFIFKTPLKLYFIVKEKSIHLQNLQQIDPESNVIKERIKEIYSMEWRLLLMSIGCPFLALFSWYSLDVFCVKYSLSTLSQLLHPYFIIIASFVSTYQPIFYVMDHFKKRMDELYSTNDQIEFGMNSPGGAAAGTTSGGGSASPSRGGASYTNRDSAIEFELMKKYVEQQLKLQDDRNKVELKKYEKEVQSIVNHIQNDLTILKRDIREWSTKKSTQLQNIEARILSMENQVELYQMVEKQKTEDKDTTSMTSNILKYVPTPTSAFKLLSSK